MTEKKCCADCKWHKLDPWWMGFGPFRDKCQHPQSRNVVTGEQQPCVTVRLMDCTEHRNQRFEPK